MPKVEVTRICRRPRLLRYGDQKKLAIAAGISQTYLCDVLNGRRFISVMKMKAICCASRKALGERRARAFRLFYNV